VKPYWPNLSKFYLFPSFLLTSIAQTVINPFSAFFFDLRIGQFNPGTFGAVLSTQCDGLWEALLVLSGSISDSSSTSQSSLLSTGLSKSPFQLTQFSLSEMHSGELSSWLLVGCQLILLISQMFNTWVRSPGRSFADKACGIDDPSHNVNAAAPACSKLYQDALIISSVLEMYPMTVICVFWAWDSFCVACRF